MLELSYMSQFLRRYPFQFLKTSKDRNLIIGKTVSAGKDS